MHKKAAGNLLFSGLAFLLVLGVLVAGQLTNYRLSALTYQDIIQQNEAQTMKNLALAAHLPEKKSLQFNLGVVKRTGEKWIVTLNNQKKYTFPVDPE